MPQKLKVYKINSVDLVDEGSCGDAHITLIKSKEGGIVMDYTQFRKSLTPEEIVIVDAEIAKAKGEVPAGFLSPADKKKAEDDAKKKAEDAADGGVDDAIEDPKTGAKSKNPFTAKVAKCINGLNDQIETLKKSATGGQESEEEILKGANLSPAVKAILMSNIAKAKAAEVAVMKMQELAEGNDYIAKAKEVAFVPEAATKVVALLKSVKGVAGASDQIMDILKSVNGLVEKGTVLGEFGTTDQGTTTGGSSAEAWAAIEKAATSLVVKGKVSKAKSIQMVMEQSPELYATYTNALRSE